ncbi:MAG: ribbon-helix-helix domain-containing protein [Bifidobacteriaceae bacterium]|nr:ribbon-helix-helix domain-containing protein [Bifidobacteriaceae bacterium]
MKTAISVPADTYARVEAAAQSRGVSRSRLFTDAAEFYLRALESTDVTARVNEALAAESAESAAQSAAFVEMGTAAMLQRWGRDPW